jgi:hypothetical protein
VYTGADPDTGDLLPELSGSAILTSTTRFGFLGFTFLSSKLETQTENKNVIKINLNCDIF